MGFRIRWIFLLLCILLFISLLILNRQPCIPSPCLQSDSKDVKLHEDRRETWEEGRVVDCVMGDEKLQYNLKNLTLQVFSAGSYSKRGEGVEKRRNQFETIFKKRDWPAPNDTSYTGLKASGPGATLHNAQRAMAVLHSVVSRLKTHLGKKKISILDVPCGDMQWMGRWLDTRWDIDYTGVDIVPDIIKDHKKTFRHIQNAEFFVLDIVSEKLNRSFDLILCRDMLQHLFLFDALTTLQRLSESGSSYLLVTTFIDTGHNEDVDVKALGGRHYSYNLKLPPFSLPPPICIGYDWNIEHLGLWPLPLKQVVLR